jgi:nucleotide-binding universal stress UspA family protein
MVEGFPAQEIIKEARKNDLIIMGSKGISALNRIFLGGVAEKVIHHSKSTVMIVR